MIWNGMGKVWPDPGQIYSFMIASGQQRVFDNNVGAGLVQLPDLSQAGVWWTAATISNHQSVDFYPNAGFTPTKWTPRFGGLTPPAVTTTWMFTS